MKDEEAQRLLGNGSNNFAAANDITTDSKKTTKKKGYSSGVRLSMAFGTFAFLLLGVVLFAGRGGKINTNIVHNIIRSGKEELICKPCHNKSVCCTEGRYNFHCPNCNFSKDGW